MWRARLALLFVQMEATLMSHTVLTPRCPNGCRKAWIVESIGGPCRTILECKACGYAR